MTAKFKRVGADELGYEPKDVDAIVELARAQFANPGSHVLDASTLRNTQFGVSKGGYQIAAVDAALDRLDDAFAAQEANRLLVRGGHQGAEDFVHGLESVLKARLVRPARNRFARQRWYLKGYSVRQVDALLRLISLDLAGADQISPALLREAMFSPRWGGYNEAQVDAFIDRTVQFLQLSRSVS